MAHRTRAFESEFAVSVCRRILHPDRLLGRTHACTHEALIGAMHEMYKPGRPYTVLAQAGRDAVLNEQEVTLCMFIASIIAHISDT